MWQVISAPGFYNASWLLLDELEAALEHHGLAIVKLPVEYRIIHVAIAQLVEEYGRERVRLVVWFS